MSRIGRKPIVLPAGVSAKVEGNLITVTGQKGTLQQDFDNKFLQVKISDNVLEITRSNDNNDVKAKHGLYRALVQNMVTGVSQGFEKILDIKGVGYKATMNGNKLILSVGFSHPVEIVEIDGIKIEVLNPLQIKISGIDKQKVGQFAAKIRDIRPVEPYHNYGIKYGDEIPVKKVGKTAGKGKK